MRMGGLGEGGGEGVSGSELLVLSLAGLWYKSLVVRMGESGRGVSDPEELIILVGL